MLSLALRRAAASPSLVRFASSAPKFEVQSDKTENGVTVASYNQQSPVSTVSIAVAAGSRFEGQGNQGAAHVLRAQAYQTSANRSGLYTTRASESIGARLGATNTRELIIYTGDFVKAELPAVLELLTETVAQPSLLEWELEDSRSRISLESTQAKADPQAATLDQLHSVAFHRGLGRPLTCPLDRVGSITVDTLKSYRAETFTGARIAVVGAGVDHAQLVSGASSLNSLDAGSAIKTSSSFFSGEARTATNSPFTHFALGFPGVSQSSSDRVTAHVLANLLGHGPSIKYASPSASSTIGANLTGSLKGAFALDAFHAAYSDAGLLGVFLTVEGSESQKAFEGVASAIKKVAAGEFTAADVARAKGQTRFQMLLESRNDRLDDIASQLVFTKAYKAPEDWISDVDSVDEAAVKKFAQAALSKQPAFSAFGDLEALPFLSDF
eukprot:m.233071 g.233071  ORF g.233071 m.233071 type:complete len:441 (-) comp26501_c0_seq1:112-1434(-)